MILATIVLVFSLVALAILLREQAGGRGLGVSRTAAVSSGISTAALAISMAMRFFQVGAGWGEARRLVVMLAIATLSACSILFWRSLRPRGSAHRG